MPKRRRYGGRASGAVDRAVDRVRSHADLARRGGLAPGHWCARHPRRAKPDRRGRPLSDRGRPRAHRAKGAPSSPLPSSAVLARIRVGLATVGRRSLRRHRRTRRGLPGRRPRRRHAAASCLRDAASPSVGPHPTLVADVVPLRPAGRTCGLLHEVAPRDRGRSRRSRGARRLPRSRARVSQSRAPGRGAERRRRPPANSSRTTCAAGLRGSTECCRRS